MSEATAEPKRLDAGAAVPPPIRDTRSPEKSPLSFITRLQVALPTVAVSFALLAWSLLFRLPNAPMPVKARLGVAGLPSNEWVSAEMAAELQETARTAAKHLMRDSKEIAPALSRLEQSARALGFQVDISMRQTVTNAAGFKELTIYPASIRLEDNYSHDRPAFARAFEWLHEAEMLPGKVEIHNLTFRSNGAGLAQAQVELHFWQINEQSAPK